MSAGQLHAIQLDWVSQPQQWMCSHPGRNAMDSNSIHVFLHLCIGLASLDLASRLVRHVLLLVQLRLLFLSVLLPFLPQLHAHSSEEARAVDRNGVDDSLDRDTHIGTW